MHVVRGFRKTPSQGILRPEVTEILAQYVRLENISPFIDPSGKPRLRSTNNAPTIFISVAHSHDLLLVALSAHADIGIDVELMRERTYASRIAARYFDHQPTDLSDFYRAWTAREAFIKTIGSRISTSLARIHTEPSGREMLIGLDRISSHTVSFFTPHENYLAALCRPKTANSAFLIIHN